MGDDTATAVLPVPPVLKKPWQSKTMWVSFVTTVLPTVITVVNPALGGAVGAWIGANHQLVLAGLGAIFGALRYVSHGKVVVADQ